MLHSLIVRKGTLNTLMRRLHAASAKENLSWEPRSSRELSVPEIPDSHAGGLERTLFKNLGKAL